MFFTVNFCLIPQPGVKMLIPLNSTSVIMPVRARKLLLSPLLRLPGHIYLCTVLSLVNRQKAVVSLCVNVLLQNVVQTLSQKNGGGAMLIFLTCLNLLLRYMKQTSIRIFSHLGLKYVLWTMLWRITMIY